MREAMSDIMSRRWKDDVGGGGDHNIDCRKAVPFLTPRGALPLVK